MPLHLLGKKSWHVYNSANVERVRRDEAEAKAREEADEQRLQLEDAQIRTSILRGDSAAIEERERHRHSSPPARERDDRPHKRRRLHGEDDTDRDIRWAREDAEVGERVRSTLSKRQHIDDRPLHDRDGHIQLVPVSEKSTKVERNAEAEAEATRQKQHVEDQYTMRFSNAAGSKNSMAAPWYADAKTTKQPIDEPPGKDVWGNEDPRRLQREQKRMLSNDPLAFMQQAQRQLKQSVSDRAKWKAEKTDELRELERDQRRSRRRDGVDDLPPLDLDDTSKKDRHHRKHHHRHRRRSRSPKRS